MKPVQVTRLIIFLGCFLGCLAPGHASDACGSGKPNILDLKPREGWQTSGALTFGADGHISLARTGQGLAWKPIELDLDEFPVLSVRVLDSTGMLRGRWKLLAEKDNASAPEASGGILLAEKTSLSSFDLIPIKRLTGWARRVKCRLVLSVDGPQGDWIGFEDLEGVRFNDERPLPPKLSTPVDSAVVSRLALHLSWYQTANAAPYELQVSTAPDFVEKNSFTVKPPWIADKLPYLPKDEELFKPGKWFWRVRGIDLQAQPGEWSATESFTLLAMAPPRPLELPVSAEHPLLLLHADPDHLEDNWHSVPQELKPYVVLRIEVIPPDDLGRYLEIAHKNHIPVVIQATGPRDYYGAVSSRVTLSEIEQIFVHFPEVKGVYLCEQAIRKTPTEISISMTYAQRLIPLAAEYGRMVLWAAAHWGWNIWIEVGLNKDLLDTIRKS